MFTVKSPTPLSVIELTLKLALIATVPVPLKFTQARQNVPIATPLTSEIVGGVNATPFLMFNWLVEAACTISAITVPAMIYPYKTTQREPLGTVTVTPLLTVTGPEDIALLPEPIV